MSGFPLIALELQRATRRPESFWLRHGPPVVMACLLLYEWLWTVFSTIDATDVMAEASVRVTYLAAGIQTMIALMGPIMAAANAIAEEREVRTWDVLQLAQVSHFDVFVSKFLGAFIPVEALILSCLPLQSVAAFMGGISIQLLLSQFMLATALCAASCALALFASSLVSRGNDAVVLSVAVLVGIAVTLQVLYAYPSTQGFAAIVDSVSQLLFIRSFELDWWRVLATVVVYFALCVLLMALTMPRLRSTLSDSEPGLTWIRGFDDVLLRFGKPNPVCRLYVAGIRATSGMLLTRLAPFLAILFAFLPLGWLLLIIFFLQIYEIAASFATSRRSGALELLFLTDQSTKDIAFGIFRAHLARCATFLPAIILYRLLEYKAMLVMPAAASGSLLISMAVYAPFTVLALVEGGLLCLALTAIGCEATCRKGSVLLQILLVLAGAVFYWLRHLEGIAGVSMGGIYYDLAGTFSGYGLFIVIAIRCGVYLAIGASAGGFPAQLETLRHPK